MHSGDLMDLLVDARERNTTSGTTGMLLFAGSRYLQQLEGGEAVVDALFSSIGRDLRHTGVRVLERTAVADRDFPDWAMGFDTPEPERLAEALDGFVPEPRVHSTAEMLRADALSARRILREFLLS